MCKAGGKHTSFFHVRGAGESPSSYRLHSLTRPLGYQRSCLRAVVLAGPSANQDLGLVTDQSP